MIKHIYPSSDPKNGIFRYGKLLDEIIESIQGGYNNKIIYHFELGYGSHKELWDVYRLQKKSNCLFVLTLHDPPVVVGKPFEKYFQGSNILSKSVRKALDIVFGRYIIKKVVNSADAVVILNHQAIKVLAQHFDIDKRRIFYSPLPPLLSPRSNKAAKQANDNILFFGNVSSRKGVELLVGAFKKLAPKYSNSNLVIAGGYDKNMAYFNRLKSYAGDLVKQKRIEFTGYVEDSKLEELIANASIVVLPYFDPGIIHASGPLVTSMAAGKAVVASDIQIFTDIIKNGQTGLLYTEGSKKELEESIDILLTDQKNRSELARNAREYISKHNNVGMIKKSLIKVYDSL